MPARAKYPQSFGQGRRVLLIRHEPRFAARRCIWTTPTPVRPMPLSWRSTRPSWRRRSSRFADQRRRRRDRALAGRDRRQGGGLGIITWTLGARHPRRRQQRFYYQGPRCGRLARRRYPGGTRRAGAQGAGTRGVLRLAGNYHLLRQLHGPLSADEAQGRPAASSCARTPVKLDIRPLAQPVRLPGGQFLVISESASPVAGREGGWRCRFVLPSTDMAASAALLLRALHESPLREQLAIVTDQRASRPRAHGLSHRFDSTHGPCGHGRITRRQLISGRRGDRRPHACRAADVDWSALGVDPLVEASAATAIATSSMNSSRRLPARAALAPRQQCRRQGPHHRLWHEPTSLGGERIVSAASCTNAIVPILAILDEAFGIERRSPPLHSVMNDQPLIDGYHHTDLRMTLGDAVDDPGGHRSAVGVARLLPALRAGSRQRRSACRCPMSGHRPGGHAVAPPARNTFAAARHQWRRPPPFAYVDHPSASIDFNHCRFRQSSMAARHGSAASGW